MKTKQNRYSDLFAIAEDLSAANRATPEQLGITGGSKGGHMTGAAITQRPDLWAVAVPRVPALDLIGSCRVPYGRWAPDNEVAVSEYTEWMAFVPQHLGLTVYI